MIVLPEHSQERTNSETLDDRGKQQRPKVLIANEIQAIDGKAGSSQKQWHNEQFLVSYEKQRHYLGGKEVAIMHLGKQQRANGQHCNGQEDAPLRGESGPRQYA